MELSGPIFKLKKRAKLIARDDRIPLNEALDRVAREEGFSQWSALSAQTASMSLPRRMLADKNDGSLFLIGGRPGQGKTTLALQVLLEAARQRRRAVLFTLETTEQSARRHLASLEGREDQLGNHVEILTSDDISSDYIVDHLSGTPAGTVAVIDYLQILDQQRSKPALSDQINALASFAMTAATTLCFISQIDRSFDPSLKALPDMTDVRLPNLLDLRHFGRACFVHDGKAQLTIGTDRG